MPACAFVPEAGETASRLLVFFDCQARTLGASGYQALAAPASSVSLLLGAFLTVLVALFGFRLLLGEAPSLREIVPTFAKIGIVLALASSWPAYRTLIYDVVIQGPGQLAAELTASMDLPGADGTMARRLDNIDREFTTIEALGSGQISIDRADTGSASALASNFDRLGLGVARTVFLLTAVGAVALLVFSAGLLLALGPLFVLFLLFTPTRGLFEGWLRGLVAIMLGLVGTAVLRGIELIVFEPWMADLIGRRAGGEPIITSVQPLLATAILFGGVSAGLLLICLRIGFSLRFASSQAVLDTAMFRRPSVPGLADRTASPLNEPQASQMGRNRASMVADSVAAVQRRQEHVLAGSSNANSSRGSAPQQAPGGSAPAGLSVPLGLTFRRTARRPSISARSRDARR